MKLAYFDTADYPNYIAELREDARPTENEVLHSPTCHPVARLDLFLTQNAL